MNDDGFQPPGSLWRAVPSVRGVLPMRARRLLPQGLAGVVVVVGLGVSLVTAGGTASASLGAPAADCVQGWDAPAAGTGLYEEALDLIGGQMGIDGEFVVDEMRYFLGPDVPWIVEPHFDVVRRWYVKASLVDDPGFGGRGWSSTATRTAAGSVPWRPMTASVTSRRTGEGSPATDHHERSPASPANGPESTTTSSPARATPATGDSPPRWKAASPTGTSSRR